MADSTDASSGVATTLPPGELPLPVLDATAVLRRFAGASTLAVSDTEASILSEPFPDEEIEILPSGEPYVAQGRYRTRLNLAFRRGLWALLPISDFVIDERTGTTSQGWGLFVRGKLVSIAWGSGSGGDSDLAQALEGAKSNALVRVCKDLGMGLVLAEKRWAEAFRERVCVLVEAVDRKKGAVNWWRRADGVPFHEERRILKGKATASSTGSAQPGADATSAPAGPAPQASETPGKAATKSPAERRKAFEEAMVLEKRRVGAPAFLEILKKYGFTAMGSIPESKRAPIYHELQALPEVKS